MMLRNRVGDTLWDALPEGSLFAQVLLYLDFCFPVVHTLSSLFEHSPSNTTLVQFQFQTLFPHLVKFLGQSILQVCASCLGRHLQ